MTTATSSALSRARRSDASAVRPRAAGTSSETQAAVRKERVWHDAVDAHRSCRAQLDSELKLSCTQSPKPIFPTCPSSPKCPNVIIGKVPRALRTHRMRTSRTPGPHLSTESSKY